MRLTRKYGLVKVCKQPDFMGLSADQSSIKTGWYNMDFRGYQFLLSSKNHLLSRYL